MCCQKAGEKPERTYLLLEITCIWGTLDFISSFFFCTHLNYPARHWTPSLVFLILTFPCLHSDVQRIQTDRAKLFFVETIRNFVQLPVGRTRSSPGSCVWTLLT